LSRYLASVDWVAFNKYVAEAEKDTSEAKSSEFIEGEVVLLKILDEVTDSVIVEGEDTIKTWVSQGAMFTRDSTFLLAKPPESAILGQPDDGFTFVHEIQVPDGRILGYAQVRLDPEVLNVALREALSATLPVFGGALLVSVFLSILLSVLFTVPISRLKRQAMELSKGDLTARVRVRSRDELGILGKVFNKMAQSLQRTYEELQEKLIEIRRLFKMATEDGLTGLYVKRHFLELLAGELQRSFRYDRPLSFLMCDIDHFKRVNDTFGHQTGDEVLSSVAKRLSVTTREGVDIIGRYGGEEFAVMLPETDEDMAWQIAERLRHAVEAEPIHVGHLEGVDEREITVNISVGLTTVRGQMTLEKLIATADKALYLSKQNGRNRSTVLAPQAV
ncbi:diguanylate cyclase, partial [candidate division WOR-3 bacterium]|nr:diguanylate cyclase [candidate division WOR-3 bacterium]MBD3365281.1 diguanylate cyclase [candidate division WOR-3 bacterium]